MKNQPTSVTEEGITIKSYGEDITKELEVFYNPIMKINRDISLLVIKSYFETINKKQIKFCDPMSASGIRELRFLKTIPECFEKITMGDISTEAINNIEKNFKDNNLSLDKIELNRADAINTITKQFYDFIEIDPFGSPVPFVDTAIQRMKHNGILSVTATDTATLCGTYPKKTLRRYGMKVIKTLWYEEVGVRNLIAYCIKEAAKHDKVLIPEISFAYEHFYKVFFKVQDSRGEATKAIEDLKYLKWDNKTQEITVHDYEDKETFGRTYVGELNNKKLLKDMVNNLNLIEEPKQIEKLLNKLNEETTQIGHYNIHKLEKEYKIQESKKIQAIIDELKEKGYEVSKPHCSKFTIKTNAPSKEIVKIMKSK